MELRLNDIEAAFRLKADEGLKALDGIVEKSKRADAQLKNLSDMAQRVGLGFAAVGAAITTAFAFAVRGAAAEQEQIAQLEGTVNSTGASFEKQRPRIESFINGLAQVTKFSDNELRPALNRAIFATNDVDKGMRAAALGAKVAAAGIGSLEQNGQIVARLFEGQARAVARLIPEFRDLSDRLDAGASESDIAAEALARLNKIAANAPPPGPLIQLTKAIGELGDAAGAVALQSITPFVAKLTSALEAITAFAGTTTGRVVTNIVLIGGVLATVVGVLLTVTASFITSGGVITAWAADVGLAEIAAKGLAAVLSPAGLLISGLAALAIFVGRSSIELDKLSKASDDARDKAFNAPRIAQFAAEMNALRGTLAQLEAGTLSASEAQQEFNRFGIQNVEQARTRVLSLEGIIGRLGEEKAAEEAAAKASADRLAANSEGKRIEALLAAMEKEKQARIAKEILEETFTARELERGKKLAAQVKPPTPEAPQPSTKLAGDLSQLNPPAKLDKSIAGLTTPTKVAAEQMGTLAERVQAVADAERGLAPVGSALRAEQDLDAEAAKNFSDSLAGLATSAVEGLASLSANFAIDFVSGVQNAGEAATKFFRQLVSDITRALAKALILEAILSAFGGESGGLGRLLHKGGLFQDPTADQMARFEGQRFVDLFFQGVSREMGNARDRIGSALTDNRQLVENRGRPISVLVNEATPETTVEFTDRKVEPRVRERARQRTGVVFDAVGNPA